MADPQAAQAQALASEQVQEKGLLDQIVEEGRFGKGDAVVVRDGDGRELGRGLARYDVADARRILGLRTAAIEAVLGYEAGPLIHADDLALAHRPVGE